MTESEKQELRGIFATLPTGNISDALDGLGLPRGAVLGLKPLKNSQPAAAGFALTILQTRRQAPPDGKSRARHGQVIDRQTRPGDMIVIDMRGITEVCTGGALQAAVAQMRGAAGYLTNGAVRDASEIAALNFPLYSAGTCPVKSGLDVETVDVNTPVYIGGVTIHPGDLVVMDDTGVVVVPQAQLKPVLLRALAIRERENKVLDLVRGGMGLPEALNATQDMI